MRIFPFDNLKITPRTPEIADSVLRTIQDYDNSLIDNQALNHWMKSECERGNIIVSQDNSPDAWIGRRPKRKPTEQEPFAKLFKLGDSIKIHNPADKVQWEKCKKEFLESNISHDDLKDFVKYLKGTDMMLTHSNNPLKGKSNVSDAIQADDRQLIESGRSWAIGKQQSKGN